MRVPLQANPQIFIFPKLPGEQLTKAVKLVQGLPTSYVIENRQNLKVNRANNCWVSLTLSFVYFL